MAFSLDKNRNKVNDIKKNIEIKKGEANNLEKSKQETQKMGMDIQSSNLDEKTKKKVMEGITEEYEKISENAKEVADEMRADIADIESLKQETQEAMESSETEKKKIEGKKAILEKIGLGKGLESSINELSDHQKDLDTFSATLSETGKELDSIHQKLTML